MTKLVLGYCPVGNGSSIEPFNQTFAFQKDASKSVAGVDAVIFWGGTDIHPSLYGQLRHERSQAAGLDPSSRDTFEWNLMKYCKVNNIPMIGVCRGAQMLCAFAGGSLIQHVTGHVGNSGGHQIHSDDLDSPIWSTSCHHQMMYPFDVPHDMIAWTGVHLGDKYEIDKGSISMDGKVEPEIVYFPEIKGLAIQGHPEWAIGSPFADFCNELVVKYLFQTEEI